MCLLEKLITCDRSFMLEGTRSCDLKLGEWADNKNTDWQTLRTNWSAWIIVNIFDQQFAAVDSVKHGFHIQHFYKSVKLRTKNGSIQSINYQPINTVTSSFDCRCWFISSWNVSELHGLWSSYCSLIAHQVDPLLFNQTSRWVWSFTGEFFTHTLTLCVWLAVSG